MECAEVAQIPIRISIYAFIDYAWTESEEANTLPRFELIFS